MLDQTLLRKRTPVKISRESGQGRLDSNTDSVTLNETYLNIVEVVTKKPVEK